jgi:hypothetical protein
MIQLFNDRILRYRGAAAHDGTGIGDVIDAYVMGTDYIDPIVMAGARRYNLLTNYIHAVERGEIISPYIEHLRNEHFYITTNEAFGSEHLSDDIAACSLAYDASRRAGAVLVG